MEEAEAAVEEVAVVGLAVAVEGIAVDSEEAAGPVDEVGVAIIPTTSLFACNDALRYQGRVGHPKYYLRFAMMRCTFQGSLAPKAALASSL